MKCAARDVPGNSYYSGDLSRPYPDVDPKSDLSVETELAASPRLASRSPEFALLCACSGVELTASRVDRIANCNHHNIRWNEFIRLAEHHGVLPLAARNLLTHATGLPAPVAQSLQAAYEINVRRNLWFAGELARIADHFETKKIRALPYKGPILAQTVYGDLTLRTFNDLDFLISPADFEPAKQALSDLGYTPSTGLRPEVERFWLRHGYERAFDSDAAKYIVELQWRLLPRFYAVDLQTEVLLQRAVNSSIGGRAFCALCPEDLLLALCLHAAKHLWMRLIWVADIAETIRTQRIDYDALLSRAQTLGITRILGVSFWLARNVLEATLPKAGENVIAADSGIEVLGQTFSDRLRRSATYDFDSSEYFRQIMKLRGRRIDRWRYVWRLLWTPGEADLATVRLPEASFPLYRVVRLGRLLRRVI